MERGIGWRGRAMYRRVQAVAFAAGPAVMGVGGMAGAGEPEPPVSSFEEPLERQLGGSIETGVAARRERAVAAMPGDPAAIPTGPREIASVSPMIRLNLRVREEVELYGSAGLVSVFTNGPEGRSNATRPSNIAFGGRRIWEWGGDRYRAAQAGVEFAIPTGYARNEGERDAFEYALAGRGGLGPWEWMPRTLSFVAPAAVAAQVFRRWVVDGQGAIAAMLPSIGDVARPTVGAQLAAGARWVLPWLAVGLHASAVYNGRHPDDRGQLAVTPSLDTNLCRRGGRRIAGALAPTSAQCPVHLSAKLNLNLDAPYGFAGDDAMGIYGLHFGLGWAIF